MTHRRNFLGAVAGIGMAAAAPQASSETDRQYWVRTLVKLADPVLRNLAAGTLKRPTWIQVNIISCLLRWSPG